MRLAFKKGFMELITVKCDNCESVKKEEDDKWFALIVIGLEVIIGPIEILNNYKGDKGLKKLHLCSKICLKEQINRHLPGA